MKWYRTAREGIIHCNDVCQCSGVLNIELLALAHSRSQTLFLRTYPVLGNGTWQIRIHPCVSINCCCTKRTGCLAEWFPLRVFRGWKALWGHLVFHIDVDGFCDSAQILVMSGDASQLPRRYCTLYIYFYILIDVLKNILVCFRLVAWVSIRPGHWKGNSLWTCKETILHFHLRPSFFSLCLLQPLHQRCTPKTSDLQIEHVFEKATLHS